MHSRILKWLVVGWLAGLWVANAAPKTKVQLVLAQVAAKAGDTVLAGVRLEMPLGYHTYWRYGGEAGKPTEIKWHLPTGITAGEIQWPLPEKYETMGIYSYVYHDEAILLVPLQLAADLPPGPLEIKATVSWLECEKLCLPGEANVRAPLEIGAATRPSKEANDLERWRKKMPVVATNLAGRASWETTQATNRSLLIEWEGEPGMKALEFFPLPDATFRVEGPTEVLPASENKLRLRKIVNTRKEWPRQIKGVLAAQTATGTVQAFEVNLSVANPGGEKATPGSKKNAEQPATVTAAAKVTWGFLLLKLAGAFLGGFIVNIMPCVLPIIALKILGFVNQSRAEPGQVRRLGLLYGAGVLTSFLVLAGIVIGLKAAGQAASWGFQFQNAQFVVVMTVLITLVALNLFGLFEITLGGSALDTAGALASREGITGAFFNGVLATILATPCTAPFLGAALGFAFAPQQTSGIILIFFLTVGLGMAFPYVLLSWHPAWLKFLPKPGAWMEKFKKAMGFPMLATAVWLYSQGVEALGPGSELWLGLFLVLIALAAWIWGEFVQHGGPGKKMAIIGTVILLAGSYGYILEAKLHWRSPVAEPVAAGIIKLHPDGIEWQPWSPEAVAAARAQGRPILVDFTASWCLTCQVNAKTSIEIPAVKQKLQQINAVALIENSRKKNARVVAELNRHGRAGVPLVLVYPKDPDKTPEVLPEILTPSLVLKALERAAR